MSAQKKRNKEKAPAALFLDTPVGCSAKEKELASLKQLFLFYAPHHSFRFTPKKVRPELFDATLLRSLTWMLSSTLSVIQSVAKNLGTSTCEYASLVDVYTLLYFICHSERSEESREHQLSNKLRSLTWMLSFTSSVIQSGAKNLGNIHLRIRFVR